MEEGVSGTPELFHYKKESKANLMRNSGPGRKSILKMNTSIK